jgi:hypothetical protein
MLDPLALSEPETPPKTNGATGAAEADADEAGCDINNVLQTNKYFTIANRDPCQ